MDGGTRFRREREVRSRRSERDDMNYDTWREGRNLRQCNKKQERNK